MVSVRKKPNYLYNTLPDTRIFGINTSFAAIYANISHRKLIRNALRRHFKPYRAALPGVSQTARKVSPGLL